MARSLQVIRKRKTYILIRSNGNIFRSSAFNVQILEDNKLENLIYVGFTATKKLGTSVRRNKAKRIMRELAKKVLVKYGKINSYYVLIAKSSIFEIDFDTQKIELKKLIS